MESFVINVDGAPIKRLSWNEHVKYIMTKVRGRVVMLARVRCNVTLSSANTIYTSLIRSILEYCDTMWGCCGMGNSDAIEKHCKDEQQE